MVHSEGYRSRCREKFSKGFRKHGVPLPGKYLPIIKTGDYVDIIVDSAIQKGMPHHFYHGRTGRVFAVFPSSVGVLVRKVVGNREILKRCLVNSAHVRPNRSRVEFINRCVKNQNLQLEAKKNGVKINTKRIPELPIESGVVKPSEILDIKIAAFSIQY